MPKIEKQKQRRGGGSNRSGDPSRCFLTRRVLGSRDRMKTSKNKLAQLEFGKCKSSNKIPYVNLIFCKIPMVL